MKQSDEEKLAIRIGAARAALDRALKECVEALGVQRVVSTNPSADLNAQTLTTARALFMASVAAYAQVLRDTGVRGADIAPAVARIVLQSVELTSATPNPDDVAALEQWATDAIGTRRS